MDSEESIEKNEKKEEGLGYRKLSLWCFGIFLLLMASLCTTFLLLYAVAFISTLPIWNPISVSSQCKIVSSSVDLRSSKVCDPGLLNYRAKHVFYPFQRNKFRCRDDYYWASVFKVEYIDHLGQVRLAWAEAPNEALPSDCRPSFSVAWLTKDKFQVNETYNCWYTLGTPRVNMYQDGFFECRAKHPTTAEMLEHFLVLSTRMLKSLFCSQPSLWQGRWDVLAGVVAGFSTSLLSFVLIGLLYRLKSCFRQFCALRMVQLMRVCFFIAYFSFMCWLALQYLHRLDLAEIL